MKTKDDSDDEAEIQNFYEKIPKDMLFKAYNPNFHLHGINIPFRMCVCAPSGAGKSNFIVNLINLFSKGEHGTFADITIVTRNADEPLYNYLVKKSEGRISVLEGTSNIPKLDDMDKNENHLVIFDDLVLSKDQTPMENYYIRARKLNCSVVYLSQMFYKVPLMIRNNCMYIVILKLQSGKREIKSILSSYGLGISPEQMFGMYQHVIQKKFQPLLIDLEAPNDRKFRRGFKEILNVEDF